MRWLITGGAGFIGANAASRLRRMGHDVLVYDNLSRKGGWENAAWLKTEWKIETVKGDIRDYAGLCEVLRENGPFDVVLHLAGQVAVTTSVANPRMDFETNALGTFNVCEAVRTCHPESILLNASTNKVYGRMDDVEIAVAGSRYAYRKNPRGINEERPLDFHSPYGCSKGAADQYIRDYARIYGLRTVNFRQSCIYGYRQFGVEDQGWVAWFTIAAVLGRSIVVYGDGKQVRDVLFIEDLIDCYLSAVERIGSVSGETFNIGGGPENTLSLLELLELLEKDQGCRIPVRFAEWRPGDQKVFVCDISKAKDRLGWAPRINPEEGVDRLLEWVRRERPLLERMF
jgi:CDP-paratose 2-epimerase